MGLQHLPVQTRFNDPWHAAAFNDAWGHCAPQKNVSYKGKVRFVLTDHSAYGSQPIVLEYDFPNLDGPYIHDALFDNVGNWDNGDLKTGVLYERSLTFRNYRWYYGAIKAIFKSMQTL